MRWHGLYCSEVEEWAVAKRFVLQSRDDVRRSGMQSRNEEEIWSTATAIESLSN
jgi:hypothetical protein